MKISHSRTFSFPVAALVLAGFCTAPVALASRRSVDEHHVADPQGQVEINNVSGQIEIVGWDKPEIEAAGTLGADVERLEITSAGSRTTIRVIRKESGGMHFSIRVKDPGDADLVIHVPQGSSLIASLVDSDLKVRALQGDQEVETVSGDVITDAARELRVQTVSGDIRVTAGPRSTALELGTVSGDIQVTGGGGDVNFSSVSGTGTLALGTVSRARIKTVSGNYHVTTGFAADGRLEAESVSGDFTFEFTGAVPPASFDVQSFSGDLKSCFGPKAVSERHGQGSRFSYQEGAGTGRVRVDTKSGDVSLCTKT
jgi:hypothetical protein